MKVSVIVPVYKVEQYLNKCIESLISQTYQNLEIILIDDGSPDGCPAICDEWAKKDKRIKVVHKQNGGVSSARNEGLRKATGEFVYFCDSDDYVENTLVETLVSGISDKEWVICGYNIVKDDKIIPHGYETLKDKSNQEALSVLIHGWDFGILWNKLYIRSLIDFEFDTNIKVREDLVFNTVYFNKVKNFGIIEKPLYYYVKRGGSITATPKIVPFDQLSLAHENMLNCLKEKGYENTIPHQNAAFLKSMINILKPFILKKITKQDKQEIIEMLNQDVVKSAFSNYKCIDFKEKVFVYLIKRKHIKLLVKLIKTMG